MRAFPFTPQESFPSRRPDVPTVAESGVSGLAPYEADSWNGIVAPAGTPREVVARLNREVVKAM